jgi:hypothetical protein
MLLLTGVKRDFHSIQNRLFHKRRNITAPVTRARKQYDAFQWKKHVRPTAGGSAFVFKPLI